MQGLQRAKTGQQVDLLPALESGGRNRRRQYQTGRQMESLHQCIPLARTSNVPNHAPRRHSSRLLDPSVHLSLLQRFMVASRTRSSTVHINCRLFLQDVFQNSLSQPCRLGHGRFNQVTKPGFNFQTAQCRISLGRS